MRMQRDRVPVLPSAAWGMAYGALVAAAAATLHGDMWTFDARLPYVASLAYLAVVGSVVAFAAYLTLLKRVGPGPSSFIGIATPVLAMLLTTAFEGYRWTWVAVAGVVLAIAGNAIALAASRRISSTRT
jgi:drug/metabolite transporter (DMT)-like permease